MTRSSSTATRHTTFDDTQALLVGTLFVSLAMIFVRQAGLLTGGTAGVAFLLDYALRSPYLSFGKLFFLINLPFYWFSWTRMGREFTIKTFIAIALLALLTDWTPALFAIRQMHPAYAAVVGGALLGSGCLFLARHKASLGGASILTLYLQERHGWRAGHIQLAIDCTILLFSAFVLDARHMLYSVLGAMAMNLFIAINHRPGRYMAM